ncbi:hypothetical protein A8B82_09735 [Sulfitobacter sp. EhC04]|nr:hypothetical protein A8B82_09735 [Sulfitobacter sp. EhC04]
MAGHIHNRPENYGELPPSWFEPCLHSAYFHIAAKHFGAYPRAASGQPRLLPLLTFLPMLVAYRGALQPVAGIELGLAFPPAAHGLVGLFASTSETLWDAMMNTGRYTALRNAMFEYRSLQQGNMAVLELRPRVYLSEFEKFLSYATATALFNILRAAADDAVADTIRLTFPWAMPSLPRHLTQSELPFDFEAQTLSIQVPLDMAAKPLPGAEPGLCEQLKMAGEDELTRMMGSTAAKVRHIIRQKMNFWPTLNEVADQLAISKRTVIRKLASEGVSYQLLLDEARCELACWFLRTSDMRLSAIAEQIGFSDQAGFTRNFLRVQGCNPSQYRAALRGALGGARQTEAP